MAPSPDQILLSQTAMALFISKRPKNQQLILKAPKKPIKLKRRKKISWKKPLIKSILNWKWPNLEPTNLRIDRKVRLLEQKGQITLRLKWMFIAVIHWLVPEPPLCYLVSTLQSTKCMTQKTISLFSTLKSSRKTIKLAKSKLIDNLPSSSTIRFQIG